MNKTQTPAGPVDPGALFGTDFFSAYRSDPKRERWYEVERDRLEALRPKGGAILDVGCGLGLFMDRFDGAKWKKFGVDVSPLAIAESRKRGITVKDYAQAYDYPDESFDVIVFRGSIENIDTPFAVVKKCASLLKKNGLMAFLSTPNSNSLCYRLFGTLPFLDPKYNYLIPSDDMLANAVRQFGMEVLEIRYPYLETPYARPIRDHIYFLLRCLGLPLKFAFWGNIIELYAEKK